MLKKSFNWTLSIKSTLTVMFKLKNKDNKGVLLSTILPFMLISSLEFISAHCPLCTIGAGAAAAGAVWLGISKVIIALFIGAFAMSMGMWFARIPKKRYIPFQKTAIITIVFLTTLLPLLPIFKAIGPLYLPFIGEYGVTYAVNYSLTSSLLGAIIVFVSPGLNKKIKQKMYGRNIPFQGILLTFFLLVVAALIIQFAL